MCIIMHNFWLFIHRKFRREGPGTYHKTAGTYGTIAGEGEHSDANTPSGI